MVCDIEYSKGAFAAYFSYMKIELIPLAAQANESNGAVERVRRSLGSYLNRLRLCDRRGHVHDVVSDAVFGKNINLGNRIAFGYELLYNRSTRISGDIVDMTSNCRPLGSTRNPWIAKELTRCSVRKQETHLYPTSVTLSFFGGIIRDG